MEISIADQHEVEEAQDDLHEVEGSGVDAHQTQISELPDELLENIFNRCSPYFDLDNVKITCKRWYSIAHKVILNRRSNFEESLLNGVVETRTLSPVINQQGQIVPLGSWATERFGHMASYYDKFLYIVGGTTHTPTTFNDMWRFDLGAEKWSRCLASGSYPTPKALASAVNYKDNLVIFGGWSHPSAYPLMQPWRIFDELHIYNFTSNRWTLVIGSISHPYPTAGHGASIAGDNMIIFGGRIFNQDLQSYPLSDSVWIFDFMSKEWTELLIFNSANQAGPGIKPTPRYGHTQITLDEEHVLVVGGCGGPNQIFSDVWLLTLIHSPGERVVIKGRWDRIGITNSELFTGNDFHYQGCKVGNSIIFLERASGISPYLAYLQYDAQPIAPGDQQRGGNLLEQRYFHSRRTSGPGNRQAGSGGNMFIYALDISQIIDSKTARWIKEDTSKLTLGSTTRPKERLLYSMVQGRAELVLFGGFYKDPTSPRCRVASDVFIIKQLHRSY